VLATDRALLVGGYAGSRNYRPPIEAFDAKSKQWTSVDALDSYTGESAVAFGLHKILFTSTSIVVDTECLLAKR
jgi:hypothetical protein